MVLKIRLKPDKISSKSQTTKTKFKPIYKTKNRNIFNYYNLSYIIFSYCIFDFTFMLII